MSLKEKLASLFRGGEKKAEEPPVPAASEAQAAAPVEEKDPALLELAPDHPLHRLWKLRRAEAGPLPPLQIRLEDRGTLPPDTVGKELGRLRQALSAAASAREKEAMPASRPEEDEEPLCLDAKPWTFISGDKLAAWVLLFPPVGQGAEANRDMLCGALADQSISYGIDEALLDRLPQEEDRYFRLFLVAKGQPALNGRDASLVDRFPREIHRSFQVDEYDQMDYTSLNLIQNVDKGDEICRMIPPTPGVPGRTVLNKELSAKDGKKVTLPKGKNTEISEDGLQLLASQTGHVEFSGGGFQVKPLMVIGGNVDYSTGNINFLGDIHIQGDVCSGFSVRAMGNIQVDGVVEADCVMEAGTDLLVAKGIQGGEDTLIRAHGSIYTKYIENASVYVRENLQTDCLMNCRVYSDGEVNVCTGRGTIIGGRTWAARKVAAQVVGSKSERTTAVILGGLPCTIFEQRTLTEELEELEKELKKTRCQLDSPVKTTRMNKCRMQISTTRLKLDQLNRELAEAEKNFERNDQRRLECSLAYAGTEVTIGEAVLRLRQENRQCVIRLLAGEIVVM